MRIKTIVFDFDGTLTPAIHEDKNLVSKLIEIKKKTVLGLATGRSMESLRKKLGDKIDLFDFIIAENGAIITLEKTGLYEVFKPSYWEEVIKRFREEGLGYDIGEVKIGIHEEDLKIACRIAGEFQGGVRIVRVMPSYFNAIPPAVNKADALLKVLDVLKVEPREVAFIGDSENDVEIAEVCGFSAAVANASDKLKSIAKYVCRRDNGEGVLEFLNLLFK